MKKLSKTSQVKAIFNGSTLNHIELLGKTTYNGVDFNLGYFLKRGIIKEVGKIENPIKIAGAPSTIPVYSA